MFKVFVFFFIFLLLGFGHNLRAQNTFLSGLKSPIIFKGDERTAYRDPAVLYHNHKIYLFFTLVKSENDGKVYSYTAMSSTKDLKKWADIKILTVRDQNLDFSSPGNVIRYKNEWILCLQTYPRPEYKIEQMPRFGTNDARIYIMRSKDLEKWSEPELLKVKGPQVSISQMGRMIDPYLLEDINIKGKWWCFYKQNGVSMSYTYDFVNWKFFGKAEAGENVCVITKNDEYLMFHSPENGIGIKRSKDIVNWQQCGDLITLGQEQWQWARGRITAGTVIDMRNVPLYGKYIMFFHGSGPLTENKGDFDKNASIGIAWSNDLINWLWPH